MALSNTSWDQILRVVLYKMREAGVRPTTNPDVYLGYMRDNWELLHDHTAVVAYLAEKDLAAKQEAHAQAVAQSQTLADEIAELE